MDIGKVVVNLEESEDESTAGSGAGAGSSAVSKSIPSKSIPVVPKRQRPDQPGMLTGKGHYSYCPICKIRIYMKLRAHVLQHHLPFWLEPQHVCFRCRFPEGSGFARRTNHIDCEKDSDFTKMWVLRCNRLLQLIANAVGVEMDGLLDFVRLQGWYPQDKSSIVMSREQCVLYRLFEMVNGLKLTEYSNYDIAPPSGLSTLLHWKAMCCILGNLEKNVQEQIKVSVEMVSLMGATANVVGVGEIIVPAIDSHCHLDQCLATQRLESADMLGDRFAGQCVLDKMIAVYITPSMYHRIPSHVSNSNVYFTVGIHPLSAHLSVQYWDTVLQYVGHPKCVAVGETGLDFTFVQKVPEANISIQKESLVQHVDLAKASGKPLVLHVRSKRGEESEDIKFIVDLLTQKEMQHSKVQVHCFCGDKNQASQWVKGLKNCKLSFGTLLIKLEGSGKEELDAALRSLPLDKVLIETDSPKLQISRAMNNPWNVLKVAEEVARVRGISTAMVCEGTRQNAIEFFDI